LNEVGLNFDRNIQALATKKQTVGIPTAEMQGVTVLLVI
jgi:hypothetical protein